MPVAEAIRLAELVAYQQAAVVSRTLINRAAGTVTLFAFDDGQSLSEHTAPLDAFVQLLEGQAEIVVSRKPLAAKAGRRGSHAGKSASLLDGCYEIQNAFDDDPFVTALSDCTQIATCPEVPPQTCGAGHATGLSVMDAHERSHAPS